MKKLKTILSSKYIFKILSLVILICDIIYLQNYHFISKYQPSDNTFIGTIDNYQVTDTELTIEVNAKEKLIVKYNFENNSLNKLSLGDKIIIEGKLTVPESLNIPNTFNYQKYLQYQKIYYIVEATSIRKIKNNRNFLFTIKNIIYQRITSLKSKDYLEVFLLGQNNLSRDISNAYRKIGASHLFSISGMHISILTSLIFFYLNKVTYNKKLKYLIADIILVFYLLLINTPSLLRSTIMFLLISINKISKLKITKVDIVLLTLALSIIINPFIIYQIGFIYSYLISSFLFLFQNKFSKKKKLIKIIFPIFLSFLVSFPITIYQNYEINFISLLINFLFLPLVSTIIFPLSLLTLLFPYLDSFLFHLLSVVEKVALFCSNITVITFIFSKPHFFLIIFYYFLLVITLKHPKYFYLIFIFIFLYYFSPNLNNKINITVFDVGEADSSLITFPFNQGNILIDTGKSSYIMENGIIPYLKSKGIRKINYLIISHGDLDHIGGASYLVDNFPVEKIILNDGENTDLELSLIDLSKEKKIKYYQSVSSFSLNKHKLYILHTQNYDNENDNSNVIYFKYFNYKFLFMGDASLIKEKDILEKYNIKDIDFLKVGHHGSSSSSSKEFIDAMKPKYSIISVGRNNSYGHPKDSVLDILSQSNIYRTDLDGSIEIKLNKKKCQIRTYLQNKGG